MAFLHAGARQGGHDLHPQVALHASMPLLLSHLDQASGLEAVLRAGRYICRRCKLSDAKTSEGACREFQRRGHKPGRRPTCASEAMHL
jgi:hypothetical protein